LKYDPLLQQPSLSTVSRTSRPRSPRNFLFSVGGGPYGLLSPRLTVCSYECDSSGRKRESATSSRGTDRFPNAQLSREKPKE
jgi:hypothetical protein